jgi:thiol-disulfide isomerase/thioredoxin
MSFPHSYKKIILILLGVVALLSAVTYLIVVKPFAPDTESERAVALKPAVERGYQTIDGTTIDLGAYDGKTLIVNSWATWCPFCVHELPDLDKIAETYADRDVIVIGINRKESNDTVKAFMDYVGNPQHITFLLDPTDNFYSAIGGFAMPETLFYKKDGSISGHIHGSMTYEQMVSLTESALTDNEE